VIYEGSDLLDYYICARSRLWCFVAKTTLYNLNKITSECYTLAVLQCINLFQAELDIMDFYANFGWSQLR
jgi:hypothetical protein